MPPSGTRAVCDQYHFDPRRVIIGLFAASGISASVMKFRLPQFISALACLLVLSAAGGPAHAAAQPPPQRTSVAVLDLGETEAGRRVADELSAALARTPHFDLVNRAQARAAARGAGYAGSVNLTLAGARDLGASIGCDFYFTGEAQTLLRASTLRPDYYESYASLFLVSTETGRLILWEHFNAESAAPDEAEKSLLAELRARAPRYVEMIAKAQAAERSERLTARAREAAAGAFEDVPEEGSPAAANFRAPQPYRSLRPVYPSAAARAAAEATVDALVEVDAAGEVKDIEIMRWAGYGLNEAVTAVVRQLHFRPAMRDGRAVPVRVLLRYNFRRPHEEGKR
ncbi:MAG: TonB family protein [Acidobacteria bacterium]|nr:TonB family protein [Acidobacteriota bacterium]